MSFLAACEAIPASGHPTKLDMLYTYTPLSLELCDLVDEYALEFFDLAAEIRSLPKNQRGNSLFPLLAQRFTHLKALKFDGAQVRELVDFSYPPKSSLQAKEAIREKLVRDFFGALTALKHIALLNVQFCADFGAFFALPEICSVRICSPLRPDQWSNLKDVVSRQNARLAHISSKATDNGTEFDLHFIRERVPTGRALADGNPTLPAAATAAAVPAKGTRDRVWTVGAVADGNSTLSAASAATGAPNDVFGIVTHAFISGNVPYRLEIAAGIVLRGAESVVDFTPYFGLGELLRRSHLCICGKLGREQWKQLTDLPDRFLRVFIPPLNAHAKTGFMISFHSISSGALGDDERRVSQEALRAITKLFNENSAERVYAMLPNRLTEIRIGGAISAPKPAK